MTVVQVVFVACVLACAIGHVAVLRSVVRRGTQTADTGVPRPKLFVELVWAAVPLLALALVLTATWSKIRVQPSPKPEMIMKVAR